MAQAKEQRRKNQSVGIQAVLEPDQVFSSHSNSSSANRNKKGLKEQDCCNNKMGNYDSCGGIGYVLGFIGAAIYYISTATGFWMGVLGVLKALVWPVFVVLKILGM